MASVLTWIRFDYYFASIWFLIDFIFGTAFVASGIRDVKRTNDELRAHSVGVPKKVMVVVLVLCEELVMKRTQNRYIKLVKRKQINLICCNLLEMPKFV